ncbi:alpha/beta hydrolase [Psychromarinibacter sp. C21-152]|uniref:Alpha/beta hydrolase n=1 Tax=Psychromarinibacter sediminicola TaxID=3033385 RepID=A0AAE3NVY9_9RHOB|nr:alpha/beta hydrolase [Psychromarinibacter sediminicola]MDF0603116.1 alpha/beta hydrolase [Psychromarinibacter sediminicola]
MTEERRDIAVNGTTLAVVRQGAGPRVLFVHGSACDHRVWSRQMPVVARRYEAISYSRRYHKPNAPIAPGEDYAMAAHADDLEALIEALAVGPVHLVGHSYGAMLALIVAGRRGALVRSLVLIEPPAFTLFTSDPPGIGELLALLLRKPALGLALVKFGATAMEPAKKAAQRGDMDRAFDVFSPGVLGRERFERLTPLEKAQFKENILAEEFTGSGFVRLDPERLREIDCPALVVSGEDSVRLWQLLADEIAERMPRARRLRLAEASHVVQADAPEAFNAALMEFLDTAEAARS